MSAADGTGPQREGRRHHVRDAEEVDRGGDADGVHDGVQAADLVQMDVLGAAVVQGGLHLGDAAYRGGGDVGDRGGLRTAHMFQQLGGAAFGRGVVDRHHGTSTDDPVGLDVLHIELPPAKSGAGHGLADFAERCAEIEQCGQQHVAGQPGDRVEPENHGRSLVAACASRWAAMAAPKPESMLTTVSPAAHDVSMASSAVRPSSAAP